MCAARVTWYSLSLPLSCVLCLCRFDLNFSRSLSLRSSFSVFLPYSKQRPAHMRVISNSILTVSELGLEFVLTL